MKIRISPFSGQPEQPIILSPVQSYAETEYSLSWRVWTPPTLPILNQSILYRLKSKVTPYPSYTKPEYTVQTQE